MKSVYGVIGVVIISNSQVTMSICELKKNTMACAQQVMVLEAGATVIRFLEKAHAWGPKIEWQ